MVLASSREFYSPHFELKMHLPSVGDPLPVNGDKKRSCPAARAFLDLVARSVGTVHDMIRSSGIQDQFKLKESLVVYDMRLRSLGFQKSETRPSRSVVIFFPSMGVQC